MMRKFPLVLLLLLPTIAGPHPDSYAELSVAIPLMKATRLVCTFTSEQQTRWGSSGPLKDEGVIDHRVIYERINHQARDAKRAFGKTYWWQDNPDYATVRLRTLAHSITFFELTDSGELDPVMTTVIDDFLQGSTKYIAARSAYITVTAGRPLAIQELGSCAAE